MEALQRATRVSVGIALRSLELLEGAVSLPQFRLLVALRELGRSPSSRVAQALGIAASSVTRLADRLHASGHVVRGTDPHNRSIVTLELTERGREIVARVMDWRRHELTRILCRLDPQERAAVVAAMQRFTEVAGEGYAADRTGPLAL